MATTTDHTPMIDPTTSFKPIDLPEQNDPLFEPLEMTINPSESFIAMIDPKIDDTTSTESTTPIGAKIGRIRTISHTVPSTTTNSGGNQNNPSIDLNQTTAEVNRMTVDNKQTILFDWMEETEMELWTGPTNQVPTTTSANKWRPPKRGKNATTELAQ